MNVGRLPRNQQRGGFKGKGYKCISVCVDIRLSGRLKRAALLPATITHFLLQGNSFVLFHLT
ncbi:hypothetical protein [Candidatus Regiella endosymbiont of Tuberolachnus salignus]|uniref:hypothetical protein n=1 Tax=Candidatus Regiella endosymbiont of Tuberolachnus salignus TaxID=3077956 RepID=UPI0030CA769E